MKWVIRPLASKDALTELRGTVEWLELDVRFAHDSLAQT